MALTGLVAATPLPNKRQTTTTPPDRYYLQTKVVDSSNDTGTDKDGLWVYSYHTGAGLGDVGLSSNKTWAWEGYLNGTQQLFTYPNAFAPWPLAVKYGPYQGTSTRKTSTYIKLTLGSGFVLTTISVSDQPSADAPGFFFNSSGLQYNYTNHGWLGMWFVIFNLTQSNILIACDWWHGVPQLFSLTSYQYGPLPTSCSTVELYPIAL